MSAVSWWQGKVWDHVSCVAPMSSLKKDNNASLLNYLRI